jgi:hypothetical protein
MYGLIYLTLRLITVKLYELLGTRICYQDVVGAMVFKNERLRTRYLYKKITAISQARF